MMSEATIDSVTPCRRFGFGSSKGLWAGWVMSSATLASTPARVFTDQGHAVEPVVLQHVHDAHEVPVEDVGVGADEDALLLGVAAPAQVLPQVVAEGGEVRRKVPDEDP